MESPGKNFSLFIGVSLNFRFKYWKFFKDISVFPALAEKAGVILGGTLSF